MLVNFLRQLQFLLKSTNQHWVLAPFVYSYLTEGVYNTKKSYKGYQKRHRLAQATIDYFQVKEIVGNPKFPIHLNGERLDLLEKETYTKLNYIKSIDDYSPDQLQQLIESIDNETILYVDSPYQSTKANEN